MKAPKAKKKAGKAAAKPSQDGRDLAGTGPVCPHCKTDITWENMGSSETEISIYVREKMYFCPECRSILGVASWHTEG
ncbi:MAG TPA: hypothetical protein VFS19_00375 [Planctomycetota bacterium]|nr:hypothetical protein [Planctomycetota bacterium]